MGAVADAALAAGGEVVGVIPGFLVDLEIAHTGLTELRVVGTLHERKALMLELSDAVVALPGGTGTLFACDRRHDQPNARRPAGTVANAA
ncbi:putative Rossmann-fold nucleotide-binding protein [Saccharothrix violaceirubra]|uniref:Putative Rossmann-fold nucleotide-binding protein n=1 Tax=Saccharothrix violaceirubra TaxID=413306 RepID=A0A7W7WWU7_9PSEU|nr:putative Rossmann-fold nucleotide-binding protein [Saccharothrix violaceirubra]